MSRRHSGQKLRMEGVLLQTLGSRECLERRLLSALFVGVFWGVLWLGAALFNLIGIDAIEKLIEHRWFWIPATTLSLSVAIHLTDVRAGLVRGTRTLVLVLLSWLLPLMTITATV